MSSIQALCHELFLVAPNPEQLIPIPTLRLQISSGLFQDLQNEVRDLPTHHTWPNPLDISGPLHQFPN